MGSEIEVGAELANRRLQPLGHSTIQNFEAALPVEDRHHAGREGRPFAPECGPAQGGLSGSKRRIPAAFCSQASETAAARQR